MIVTVRSRVYLEPRSCLILAKILHSSIARFLNDLAKEISKILLQYSHVILHYHHNKNLHVFGTSILPYFGKISCRKSHKNVRS